MVTPGDHLVVAMVTGDPLTCRDSCHSDDRSLWRHVCANSMGRAWFGLVSERKDLYVEREEVGGGGGGGSHHVFICLVSVTIN